MSFPNFYLYTTVLKKSQYYIVVERHHALNSLWEWEVELWRNKNQLFHLWDVHTRLPKKG